MKTLVTGSTGFLGSAILRKLLEDGREVKVLIREKSNTTNIDGIDVEIAYGDLRDSGSLQSALNDATFYTIPPPTTVYGIKTNNSFMTSMWRGPVKFLRQPN